MPQIFHPRANHFVRYGAPGILVLLGLIIFAWFRADRSVWETRVDVAVTQPVPFSHKHHVSGLGIDCRYCHSSVEVGSSAGMPSTHTCMTCHSQVWTEAEVLEPVRRSLESGRPIKWQRVHDLPDFVYFHHGIHVNKGVACETCHGRVDQMPLVSKEHPLFMSWCLDCHRAPEKYIRPREAVFVFGYQAESGRQQELGRELVERYNIQTEQLTDCSICHR